MTRIFIRDEYYCGQNDGSAENHAGQFDAPLFGRTHEIGLLSHAWIDPQSRLFLLNGPTGMGKTALLHKWLHTLQKKHWHDAEAVFVWSFYPPDLAHAPQDPVEEFFHHALYWFGGEEAARCPNLLQGEYLAKLVQSHHTLLILDGLEVLQFKSGAANQQLGDPRLGVLLEHLAKHNTGLCITVSREPLLGDFTLEQGVQRHELEKLPLDAAIELLDHKGVQGDKERLQQMAIDYDQNPLTLGLLGGYLAVWHSGDWRQMEKIPVLMDQQLDGRQARRILVANATELAGMPGESILYLLCMLYRPTHWDTLETLLGKGRGWSFPAWFNKTQQDNYASLIGRFLRLSQHKRYQAILQLRELGLLELSGRCFWLAHWVREAFQRQLRYDWPSAWKETNQRLMQYHASLPKEPEDLTQIIPLTATHKSAKVAGPFGKQVAPTPAIAEVAAEENIPVIAAAVPVQEEPAPTIAEEPVKEAIAPVSAEVLIEDTSPTLDLNWLNSLTPVIAAVQAENTAPAIASTPVEEAVPAQQVPVPAIPEQAPTPTAIPARPALTRTDLENMANLMAQLKNYQNSLQILQIRTKKYQKQVRQFDKEVQSMRYPYAKTGTDS